MSGLDLRLAVPALAAWIVAWQGRLLPPAGLAAGALVAAVVGVAVLLLSRRAAAAGVAAVLACAAAAGLATAARVHARTSGPLAEVAARQAAVTVEGVLIDDPRAVPPKGAVLAFRPLVATRLRVERLEVAGTSVRVRLPVLVLSSEDGWLGLLPSQRVRVEGRLDAAERGDDVAAVLSARGDPVVRSGPSAVQRVAGRLRAGLREATDRLPPDERGLLPGLVDGDTSRLDPELRDAFRATGLTHLTAVSGTNVAVVLGAALLLCARLGLPLRARPPAAGLVLLAFVVLARPSPSVLRAAAMGAIALLAMATGTRRQAMPALCAAVLGLVLLSPDLAAQPGFALSTLATAGLLVVAPVWRDRLARRLPLWLAEALAVPAAAQLACTPVVVALSGQLGLLAVPANVLAVPVVAPATVLGVVAALVAPVWLPVAQLVAWGAYLPTHWLVVVARYGEKQPGAGVTLSTGWAGACLAVVLLLLGAVVVHHRGLRRAGAAVAVGSLVAVLALVVVRPGWPPRGWVLASCDVGQGDGFVVRLGPQDALVVDTGPQPEPIDRCLRRLGVTRVPLLVLTHLHADHVEGVPGLLRGRRVGAVETGPLDEPAVELARLQSWLQPRGIPLLRARIGEIRSMGGVRWEVLDATARHGTDSDPNNSSVVLRLDTHGVRVLFAGDLEDRAQQEVRERGVDLRADVLKVPHHGSQKQDPAFLDAVGAKVALTPVGAGNPYGHPSAETLSRLRETGARIYRSDTDGDVAVVERGGRLTTVGRGGDGVAPARAASGDHHDVVPVAAALRLALPVPLGLCASVAPTGALGSAVQPPRPRARSPTWVALSGSASCRALGPYRHKESSKGTRVRLRQAVVTGSVALLGFALPAVGSLVYARHDAAQVLQREATFYADDALHRSDATGRQADQAVLRLTTAHAGCDARGRALMQDLDVTSSYVQAVGVARNGVMVCSSLSGMDLPLELGPVDYVSPRGTLVRTDEHFPFAPETGFIVLEKAGYVAVIHKALPIDVSTSRKEVGLALVAMPGGQLLTSTGDLDPAWLRPADVRTGSSLRSHRAVASAVSREYYIATVAALPRSATTSQLRSSMLKLVPGGVLLGLVFAGAALLLGRRRTSLPAEIRLGMRRREFALEYQPVVDLRTREVVGVEALLRWHRPYGLNPPPDLFIPAAERAGIMPQLTAHVLGLLAADAGDLVAEHPRVRISVNLSAADVHEAATVQRVREVVEDLAIPPGRLVVEITERAVVDPVLARPVLTGLREAGVLIAIDDFGTGYSSLASLQSLDVDIIKIDKAFVDTLGTEAATSQVVHHIIDMADALDLETVAEGVESEEQARLLAARGVPEGQGWLFGRSVPMAVLLATLRESSERSVEVPEPRGS